MKIVKISLINDVLINENKKIKKNLITKNNKFERVNDIATSKYIKKVFFNNVSNNTNKKNFLRIC